jgi:hypothetical protein
MAKNGNRGFPAALSMLGIRNAPIDAHRDSNVSFKVVIQALLTSSTEGKIFKFSLPSILRLLALFVLSLCGYRR